MDPKTEYLHAVVVGLFETRTPLTKLVVFSKAWPNGFPFGFGPLSTPAQILLRSLNDLRIEKKRLDESGATTPSFGSPK
jgi:hypothetical protein